MSRWSSAHGRPERRRVLLFVAVALAAHALALPFLSSEVRGIGRAGVKPKPIKVVNLSPATLEQLRQNRAGPLAAKTPPPAEKPEEKKEKLEGQIVDVPPTADDRAPEDARYLSEHDTRVERETRSRNQSQFYRNSMNEPATTSPGNVKGDVPPQQARALEIGPKRPSPAKKSQGKAEEPTLELPRVPRRDRLALKLDPDAGQLRNQSETEEMEGNGDRLRLSPGSTGDEPAEAGTAPAPGAPALELVPQVGVLAKIAGAPANDALDDLEEGEGTFLNSREFKYASFFNRLKRGVSENWRPFDEYRRRDPTGNIYGFRSRVTVIQVTLNPDGSLKDVEVARSSGIDFLDREALAALQRAEPFPNPPKGLVGNEGQISFPFGFQVDFSGAVRMPFSR